MPSKHRRTTHSERKVAQLKPNSQSAAKRQTPALECCTAYRCWLAPSPYRLASGQRCEIQFQPPKPRKRGKKTLDRILRVL